MKLDLTEPAADFLRSILRLFERPASITVAEWAEQSRIIPLGNAEPGRWSNERAPYLTEVMEAVTDTSVSTLVVTGCSQSGKTALAENIVGHAACCDPCTVVWAGPNDAATEAASTRFDAMIASTPDLKSRFGSRTARSEVNNIGLKAYVGGKLVFASAGSPSSLASHPARIVIGDEIDRWPVSLRKEGDPVAIIRARTTTFSRGKAVFLSSPTQEGASRIEALAAESDLREWNWRCDCGADHIPQWEHVQWTTGQPDGARYVMPCCGMILDDATRWRFMQRGRWIATQVGQPGVRSYRFRGLSSPWLRMGLLASEFEQARGNVRKLAPFFNTRLGLPFEMGQGEGTDAETVRALAENYSGHECPLEAGLIVASIDVQGGWLAVLIAAVGDGDEMWALQFHEVQGDVKDPATRAKAEDLIYGQKFRHPMGAMLDVEAVAVDSGYETTVILEWSQHQRAKGRRFFATKGVTGWKRGLWERGGDIARSMARHFVIGADQGKAQIIAGLAMADAGPGKVHTHTGLVGHFWSWATAEELLTTETAGGTRKEWRMRRGERRNEALDCLVLAAAVAHSQDFGIGKRIERLLTTGSVRPPQPSMSDLAARAAALTH